MFSLYICLCTACVPGALGGQKRASDSGNGIADSCKHPYGCCELNPDSLKEKLVLLTPETSHQPLKCLI